MRVKEVMSDNVKAVAMDTPADDAWEIMRREQIHHLLVKDGKAVVGVFTARDAGGGRGASVRAGRTVAELMSRHVISVHADATLKRVANLMRGHVIGCVVVFDKDKPVGIVTTSDLLDVLGRGVIKPAPVSKRAPLNYRAPHTKRHRAFGVW